MAESICPASKHCSQWAEIYFSFCLCSFKDGVSLSVGFLSVISWGVAEIPQIMTNYREKSAHGLSLAFLITWIVGDLFNLFGCILEPATLPTQYYMAMLYTFITTVLTAQTVYYGHIYPRMKRNRWHQEGSILNQTEDVVDTRQESNGGGLKLFKDEHQWRNGLIHSGKTNTLSAPIPLPAFPCNSFPGRELYYVSARSLTSSHMPIAGSFVAHRMAPSSYPGRSSAEEPLLDGDSSTRSAPNLIPKNLLSVVSIVSFLGVLNLHQSVNRPALILNNENQGYVLRVGRNILQASGGIMHENHIEGNAGIGTFFGWAMAVIYMGGRLPQIWLNIKRGNVEGLNPLMFVFALVGNTTYVASILLNSMEWVKIKPNLPWLVDAGGCVLLDTFILIQFIYFRHWIPQLRTRQKTTVLK